MSEGFFINKDAIVVFISVFSAVATIANLFLMIAILASASFRTSSKHILIFVLCLTDFYMGVVRLPLRAQGFSLGKWIYDITLFKALHYSVNYIMLTGRITLMIGICASCILSMITRNRNIHILLSVSMIVCSVGCTLIFVLPVTETSRRMGGMLLTVPGFFPQVFVMIILVVDIIIMSRCVRRFNLGINNEESRRIPVDVFVACVLMLVCIIPDFVFADSDARCTDEANCKMWVTVQIVAQLLENFRPCLMPFVWLLCRETRQEIKMMCRCVRKCTSTQQTGYTDDIMNCEMQIQPQTN